MAKRSPSSLVGSVTTATETLTDTLNGSSSLTPATQVDTDLTAGTSDAISSNSIVAPVVVAADGTANFEPSGQATDPAEVVEVASITFGQFVGGDGAPSPQVKPHRSVLKEHQKTAAGAGPTTVNNTVASEVDGLLAELASKITNLSVTSPADVREQARVAIQTTSLRGSLMDAGSVEVRRLTVAGTTAYFITAGTTEEERKASIIRDLARLELPESRSKKVAANAVIVTNGLNVKETPNNSKQRAQANSKFVDRDALAVQSCVNAVYEDARAGGLKLSDGTGILNFAMAFIAANDGVVAVSEAERKRINAEKSKKAADPETDGFTAIALDPDLYATKRSEMAKKTLAEKMGPNGDVAVGLAIMVDGKATEFLPTPIEEEIKRRLLDGYVVPPANVEFLAETLVLGRCVAEVATDKPRSKDNVPQTKDAKKVEARRVAIIRQDGSIVVGFHTAGEVFSNVVLDASPVEPLFRDQLQGDLIMPRHGYMSLAVNLAALDRRAAFAFKAGQNQRDSDGSSPMSVLLSTKVAQLNGDTNYAYTTSRLARADWTSVGDIRIANEAAIKPVATAKVQASVFEDVGQRISSLDGKAGGDRVKIIAAAGSLTFANDAGKAAIGCDLTIAGGGALTVEAHKDDLTSVVKAIAAQPLSGPVVIDIDRSGVIRFAFSTAVGQFKFFVPVMNNLGRNSLHCVEYKPAPWTNATPSSAS